jgi:hypothetical protein
MGAGDAVADAVAAAAGAEAGAGAGGGASRRRLLAAPVLVLEPGIGRRLREKIGPLALLLLSHPIQDVLLPPAIHGHRALEGSLPVGDIGGRVLILCNWTVLAVVWFELGLAFTSSYSCCGEHAPEISNPI